MNKRKKALGGAVIAGIISAIASLASAGIGAGVSRRNQKETEKNQTLAQNEANRTEFLNNQQQLFVNSKNNEIETLKTNMLPTLNEQTSQFKCGGRKRMKIGGESNNFKKFIYNKPYNTIEYLPIQHKPINVPKLKTRNNILPSILQQSANLRNIQNDNLRNIQKTHLKNNLKAIEESNIKYYQMLDSLRNDYKINNQDIIKRNLSQFKFGGRRVCKRGDKVSDLSYLKKYI